MLVMLLLQVLMMGLLPPLALADLVTAPSAETVPMPAPTATPKETIVWWRSTEGSVIERRSDGNADCQLHLNTPDSDVRFYWVRDQPAHLTVTHKGWNFIPEGFSLSAMRIGAVWLGNSDGTAKIMTLLYGPSATMMLSEPVDGLLLSADQIILKLEADTLSIPLARAKMPPLVTALRKCLKSISR